MKLIDKDALVAEINRQISAIDNCPKITNTQIAVLEGDKVVLTKMLSFIDTLEVKEVDLEKDSLTWKDINLIDYLLFDIKEDYDNGKLDKEKYYKEVLKKFKAQKGE